MNDFIKTELEEHRKLYRDLAAKSARDMRSYRGVSSDLENWFEGRYLAYKSASDSFKNLKSLA